MRRWRKGRKGGGGGGGGGGRAGWRGGCRRYCPTRGPSGEEALEHVQRAHVRRCGEELGAGNTQHRRPRRKGQRHRPRPQHAKQALLADRGRGGCPRWRVTSDATATTIRPRRHGWLRLQTDLTRMRNRWGCRCWAAALSLGQLVHVTQRVNRYADCVRGRGRQHEEHSSPTTPPTPQLPFLSSSCCCCRRRASAASLPPVEENQARAAIWASSRTNRAVRAELPPSPCAVGGRLRRLRQLRQAPRPRVSPPAALRRRGCQ